jgi:hypothetical protein
MLESPARAAQAGLPASAHLLHGSAREILARILPGDPLGLRARIAARLAELYLISDADHLQLQLSIRVARQASFGIVRGDLHSWILNVLDPLLDPRLDVSHATADVFAPRASGALGAANPSAGTHPSSATNTVDPARKGDDSKVVGGVAKSGEGGTGEGGAREAIVHKAIVDGAIVDGTNFDGANFDGAIVDGAIANVGIIDGVVDGDVGGEAVDGEGMTSAVVRAGYGLGGSRRATTNHVANSTDPREALGASAAGRDRIAFSARLRRQAAAAAALAAEGTANPAELGITDTFASSLGLAPAAARRAIAALNDCPIEQRRAFHQLVLQRRSLDELARVEGVSASEIGRRARQALDVTLRPLVEKPAHDSAQDPAHDPAQKPAPKPAHDPALKQAMKSAQGFTATSSSVVRGAPTAAPASSRIQAQHSGSATRSSAARGR